MKVILATLAVLALTVALSVGVCWYFAMSYWWSPAIWFAIVITLGAFLESRQDERPPPGHPGRIVRSPDDDISDRWQGGYGGFPG